MVSGNGYVVSVIFLYFQVYLTVKLTLHTTDEEVIMITIVSSQSSIKKYHKQ